VQRSHALLAHRIEARQRSLGTGDGVVVQVRDQAVGGGQASSLVSRTITCRRMPKRTVGPAAAFAHLGDLLGNGGRWLAPGQVQLDLLGRQVLRASEEPPKYSGGRGC
jgi:hypothetical protein